jgi:spermidine synthase
LKTPEATFPSAAKLPLGLSLAFAASGFAALIDEVAASRALAIPLGADAAGVAAVLTALLLGFAAGGAGAGSLLARGVDVRRLALAIEAALALCAICAPFAFPSLGSVVAALGGALPIDGTPFALLRFVIALAACLPAALLMGATFPVALRLARAEGLAGANAAAAVYAPNTLGAALGALACGALLLPLLGYVGTFAVAAVANAASFALLWRFARASSAADEAPVATRGRAPWKPLVATFCAGFAAFALEGLLTRAAITVFGASTYAFTAILLAFLVGLSLGAPLARRAGTDPARAGRGLLLALLAAALLARAGILGFQLYLGLDDPFHASNRFPQLPRPWLLPLYQGAVSMILLLPPALAFGAAFPLAVGAARAGGASPDRAAASVYALNTLGCLAGILVSTFVLLPTIGSRGGIEVVGAVLIAGALVLVEKRTWPLFTLLVLYPLLGARRFGGEPGVEVLFHREGVASTVTVTRSEGEGGKPMRSIAVNGTVVATEGLLDLRLQRLLGHLPALLHPNPKNTLVIGLGSGVTAGALSTTPGVDHVDVVELERFVAEGARLFDDTNDGVASGARTNTKITIADGRTHLLTTKKLYDVVTCDPIHPWVAGAGNLYSRECFEAERAVLAPGGLAALWLPLYKLRTEDLRTIAKTWTEVFSPAALYVTGYDAILIGGNGGFPTIDSNALRARFAAIADRLRRVEVRSVEELMSGFAMGDAELRAFAGDAPANTDARPILEYRAPLLYLTDYATDFLGKVARAAVSPDSLFGPGARFDPVDLAGGLDLRARAIERFLTLLPQGVRGAIAGASEVLHSPR